MHPLTCFSLSPFRLFYCCCMYCQSVPLDASNGSIIMHKLGTPQASLARWVGKPNNQQVRLSFSMDKYKSTTFCPMLPSIPPFPHDTINKNTEDIHHPHPRASVVSQVIPAQHFEQFLGVSERRKDSSPIILTKTSYQDTHTYTRYITTTWPLETRTLQVHLHRGDAEHNHDKRAFAPSSLRLVSSAWAWLRIAPVPLRAPPSPSPGITSLRRTHLNL